MQEAVIVSTCNRTEVYVVADDTQTGLSALGAFFAHAGSKHGDPIVPSLMLFDDEAVQHLLGVASGFDSMVIGEGQILGQIREALEVAQQARSSGPILNKLFNLAIHCGKRVRTESGISRKAVSIASAAVELADAHGGLLPVRRILIVGAGRMGSLCAKHLFSKKMHGQITVFNQSPQRLEELSVMLKGAEFERAIDSTKLAELCEHADTIFVATSSDEHVLKPQHFENVLFSKLIFDLGMPRNVDPKVSDLEKVQLFSIDDLQSVVDSNLAERHRLMLQSQPILHEAVMQFHKWLGARHSLRLVQNDELAKTV